MQADEYSKLGEAGWYEAQLDGFTLDFYYRPSDTKTAYIISPGWINRVVNPYPYFQRIRLFDELDGVGISLADPTQQLAENVQIGWFMGTTAIDYTKTTAAFLEGLLKHLGIPNNRALFFGTSAGGFSSLAFATYVKGSRALAGNPQTEILRFHAIGELAKAIQASFRDMTTIKIQETMPWRVSIAELWKREAYVPPVTVLINTYDDWHMSQHIMPLVAGLELMDVAQGMDIRFFSDEPAGHNPPSPARFVPIMNEIMAAAE